MWSSHVPTQLNRPWIDTFDTLTSASHLGRPIWVFRIVLSVWSYIGSEKVNYGKYYIHLYIVLRISTREKYLKNVQLSQLLADFLFAGLSVRIVQPRSCFIQQTESAWWWVEEEEKGVRGLYIIIISLGSADKSQWADWIKCLVDYILVIISNKIRNSRGYANSTIRCSLAENISVV